MRSIGLAAALLMASYLPAFAQWQVGETVSCAVNGSQMAELKRDASLPGFVLAAAIEPVACDAENGRQALWAFTNLRAKLQWISGNPTVFEFTGKSAQPGPSNFNGSAVLTVVLYDKDKKPITGTSKYLKFDCGPGGNDFSHSAVFSDAAQSAQYVAIDRFRGSGTHCPR